MKLYTYYIKIWIILCLTWADGGEDDHPHLEQNDSGQHKVDSSFVDLSAQSDRTRHIIQIVSVHQVLHHQVDQTYNTKVRLKQTEQEVQTGFPCKSQK